MQISFRQISLFGGIVCCGVLASAYYIEYQYLLSPCPLCTLQRLVFACLAVVFLVGALRTPPSLWRYIIATLVIIFSSIGLGIASRQFWLQYYAAPQYGGCSADFARLVETYPILKALTVALRGSAECSTIDFTILTISFAGWSMIIFGLFIIICLYIMFLQKKRRIL